ncbi:serine hydrolase [Streptomyces sp. NPDC099088]|uniref:serine hydrolase n=1 Tax=Streptomyces sp. NPDC099088 TaxID=3366101 RepID=UPI00380C4624
MAHEVAPGAALLAAEGPNARFANAGVGIARSDPFRPGSVTKRFVAPVVPQLAAGHRLSLSDSVDDRPPGLVRGAGDDGRRTTARPAPPHRRPVRVHLGHRGGTVPLTPLQSVRIALPHPPTGLGRFASSNTNYVLLDRVVERVTGRSYAAEAERRIITPLRPTGASFPGAHASLPPPHGRAYTADGPDVTELDPRGAGAAGEHGRGHGPALEPAVLAAEFCPRTP